MLTDRIQTSTVDQALEDLDARWFAAEAQAHRYGELYSFHYRSGDLHAAFKIHEPMIQFIEQFGPWMQRRLADTFWIATKTIH